MDKNVLRKFAVESRQELIDRISHKIKKFYINEDFKINQNGDLFILSNENHTLSLTKREYDNRKLLIKRINEITMEQVIEEAAFTWFNRIIAIRYMEIHDYLPLTKDNQSLGIRVLSSKDNTPDPEIMKISNLINPELDIEFNKEYYSLIQDNNKRFEYILLLICRKLGRVIPQVFDGITDYIDILIPDNLLNDSGYINKVLKDVSEDNFKQVEIIGWLYQYYISEKKDIVFNNIKNNKKVTKDNIPAATQLFTPDWIVKYLVQNSLGKYFIENNGNLDCSSNWKFISLENIRHKSSQIPITEIKLFDPCCGSGHILVYAFEVLYEIYEEKGYSSSSISENILKNNLYGVDIDLRATQLTILSLLLKAREYDRHIFNNSIIKNLNISNINDSNKINKSELNTINDLEIRNEAEELVEMFNDATEIGSLLKLDRRDFRNLTNYLNKDETIFDIVLKQDLLPIIKQYNILSDSYDIVITNPPYMSKRVYDKKLANYLDKYYPISKYDLYTAFITKNLEDFCKENGIVSMITIHTWMFISMYESLRENILNNYYIENMLHLGANTFEELNSFNVLATAFCIRKCKADMNYGVYKKLDKLMTKEEKINGILDINNRYIVNQKDFFAVVGQPLVYWMTSEEREIFLNNKTVREQGEIKQGMATSDNQRFLRFWYEVDFDKIGFNILSNEDSVKSHKKWFPYNKGGDFRKWYGNNELVVNWENNGFELKEYTSTLPQGTAVRLKSQEYYFKSGITWSLFGFENFGVRYKENGYIFDISGSSMFFEKDETLKEVIAFLSSKVAFQFLTYIAPTVNFQIKNIGDLPFIKCPDDQLEYITKLVDENIQIAKEDWDSYETSWDFKHLQRISNNSLVSQWTKEFIEFYKNNYKKLKENEEKINEFYINLYNLKNISKNVIERDMSIKIPSELDSIKKLISYSVGCMFGRYSIDTEELTFTSRVANINKFDKFDVDSDNIIPITDEKYFTDDLSSRFIEFIAKVFGEDRLYDNLEYIAEILGKKNGENSERTIRRYFINDFYADHIKIYQKRPIYWLFNSGKKNGFKCLIYMHRYNEGTVSKIRLDYLHRIQNSYEKELKDINDKLLKDISLSDKKELTKRQSEITSKLQETNEYDEKIAHIADQKINIDLDNGVISNYEMFSVKNPKTGKKESILAKII